MAVAGADALVEREADVAGLLSLLQDAGTGTGGLCVVEGPPGIGKTRLLDEARSAAVERGMVVLDARGGELEREMPLGVVRQLFEAPLRRTTSPEREELLSGPAARAAPLLLDALPDTADPGAGDRAWDALHSLYWLTSNWAERAPLLIAVDDLHFCDSPSLRFLGYLARRIADLPAALVVALRSTEPEADDEQISRIRAEPRAAPVLPAPLSPAGVAELVRAELDAGAPAEFCDACHHASGGNPFLVSELVTSLAGEGIEASVAAAKELERVVPESVGHHVLVRLARLPAEAVELARAVAVLGAGVDLRLAGSLAGLDEDTATEAADVLERAELVRATPLLELAHPLIGEAIYDDLTPGEAGRAHSRAAELLHEAGADVDRVAAQLLAAGRPLGERWAGEALRTAAGAALARGAPESAASFLRHALEEPQGDDERGQAQFELAAAELVSGSPERALGVLEGLLEAPGEGPGIAVIAPLLHVARWGAGRFDAATEIADRGVPELARLDPASALLLEINAALAVLQREGFAAAAPRLRRIARHEEDAEPPRLLAAVLVDLAELVPAERPIRLAEAAAARFEGVELPLGLQPFAFLIVALHALERYDTALGLIETTIEGARTRGDATALLVALGWRAWNASDRGALDECRADAELELGVARDADVRMFDRVAVDLLMWVASETDPHGELARWGEAPFERRGDASDWGVLTFRGLLRLAQGRHEQARDDLSEASAGYDRLGLPGLAAGHIRPSLALAHQALGQHELAEDVASEGLRRAERVGTPRLHGVALRSAALTGPADERLERLREAVAMLEASAARLDLAHALTDLGAELRRHGERRAAREPLDRALELARECGAAKLEARADLELRQTGIQPRRAARLSGLEALTPSERRVASMAAEGLANREIAAALFVTLKTVEKHLSNAYGKLGIGSRHELGEALRPAREPAQRGSGD